MMIAGLNEGGIERYEGGGETSPARVGNLDVVDARQGRARSR